MARRLGVKVNKLTLQDNLSNSEIVLFYRMPTTEEISAYSNGMIQRKGNKIKRLVGEVRQRFGAKIMTGVGPESFEKEEDGKWLPVISEKALKGYDKNWRRIVTAQAPDIVEALAIQVFEASVQRAMDDDDDDEDIAEK